MTSKYCSSSVCVLSYLTYIKLCTLVKRNESMAHTLQAKLKEPQADESKRGPRPQDLIRLYDIILQVHTDTYCLFKAFFTSSLLLRYQQVVWKGYVVSLDVSDMCLFYVPLIKCSGTFM